LSHNEPAHDIAEKELIGRRIFARKIRPVQPDQTITLKWNDFHETRKESDLSMDRLGNPTPVAERLSALTFLAERDASRRNPPPFFNGWAAIQVKDLRFGDWAPQVTSAPTMGDDGHIENRWHANISCDEFRKKIHAYAFAVILRDRFEKKGCYVAPVRPK
jgi:hypothetical protein